MTPAELTAYAYRLAVEREVARALRAEREAKKQEERPLEDRINARLRALAQALMSLQLKK